MLAQLGLNFDTPFMAVIGVVCTYLVVCFPFAIWAMKIARPDALSGVEAYIVGQALGPPGVWLVMLANRKAADRAYRQGLLTEELRKPDHQQAGQAPNVIEQPVAQQVQDMPGGRAFRKQHDIKPVAQHKGMQTVGMNDPVRPAPQASEVGEPIEPPPPPPKKAAGAWQPPPSDYKFTHSDEEV